MAKTNTGLVNYCYAQLGRPYWYGTYGQTATRALFEEKLRQYPDKIGKWSKESYMDQLGQRVHDCAGLIKGYMFSESPNSTPVYNSKYDLSSKGMIDACTEQGSIDTLPEVAGLILWKSGHVGVYVGNGKAIEAKGHMYGVVETTDTKWVKWGRLPWLEYDAAPAPAPAPDMCKIDLPVCRKGSKNVYVYRIQLILRWLKFKDQNGVDLEIDGSFGSKTTYALNSFKKVAGLPQDGVCDQITWTRLMAF